MGSLPTPEREAFWRGLIAHYSRRVRGYARRAHCHEVADDILWDVWQMATERETELMGAPDCWPILHDLVKAVLHDRKRAALYERELDAEATKTEAPQPEAAEEIRARDDLIEWALGALHELTEKQRLAVDYRFRWNWPYRIVAAAIDSSEPTTRVHVMRGLARLRQMADDDARRAGLSKQ